MMSRMQVKDWGRLKRGSSGEAAADTKTLEHAQKALMAYLPPGKAAL
jgi:hypothetical protein